MDWVDPDKALSLLNAALSHEVTQFSLAFGLAALIHAHQVKKEIANQMSQITEAVRDVAKTLREDLAEQSRRIGFIEDGVNQLQSRVESLEKEKKK